MTKILVSCGCLDCSHCVVQNFGKNGSMFGLQLIKKSHKFFGEKMQLRKKLTKTSASYSKRCN
jgi:hypothetical protein